MLVRGKTPSLMVDHGSVRHSPNLEGLAVHVLLSLSFQEEDVCTVLCCENKHVGWHSLGNLDPESARSRESNLVHRAGVCWLHPLFVTPKCLLVCDTVHMCCGLVTNM